MSDPCIFRTRGGFFMGAKFFQRSTIIFNLKRLRKGSKKPLRPGYKLIICIFHKPTRDNPGTAKTVSQNTHITLTQTIGFTICARLNYRVTTTVKLISLRPSGVILTIKAISSVCDEKIEVW